MGSPVIAGVDVAVADGRVTVLVIFGDAAAVLVCVNGTTTVGFSLWVAAGGGGDVVVITDEMAASLVAAGMLVVAPAGALVLISSAKAVSMPAARTSA